MTEQQNKEKICPWQVVALLVLTVLPTAVLFVPAITARKSLHDGWMSMLLALVFGLGSGALVVWVNSLYPGQTLKQMMETALGKYPGRLLGLFFAFWSLLTAAAVVRQYAEFVLATLMPETPPELIILVMILLTGWAVYAGLEVMARAAEFIFPIVAASLLLLFFVLLPDMKLDYLKPMLEFGPGPLVLGALVPAAWMGEVVIFTAILPHLNRPAAAWRSILGGQLVTGLLLVIVAVLVLGMFDYEMTARLLFPTFSAARQVKLGTVADRLDVLLVAVWLTGVFIKMAVFKYMAVIMAAQSLGLKDYRVLVAPLCLLVYAWSLALWDNIQQLVNYLGSSGPIFYLATVEITLPLLLLVLGLLRRKWGVHR